MGFGTRCCRSGGPNQALKGKDLINLAALYL